MKQQLSLLDEERERRPDEADDVLVAAIAARTVRELAEEPPIDLKVVAASRGVVDIRREPIESAGSLTPEPDGLVIRVRRADSFRRQRFTGFHEVAHTFQPGYREQTLFRCEPRAVNGTRVLNAEALSDIGAAELLLPEEHFAPDVTAGGFGIGAVVKLARRYQASIQATAYRFSAYWPEPILVVLLEPGLRKAEMDDPSAQERLRVVSAWSPSGHWPFIRPNKSADDDSPLVQAFTADAEPVEGRASLVELAGDSPDKLQLSAQAFTYRNSRGALTRRVMALYRQVNNSTKGAHD
jgi:uncharacterized protein DUF955